MDGGTARKTPGQSTLPGPRYPTWSHNRYPTLAPLHHPVFGVRAAVKLFGVE